MKHHHWVSILILLSATLACGESDEPDWKNDLDTISQLNCNAIQLREARFSLADSMRAYQDSLLDHSETMPQHKDFWESQLAVMEERKEYLANTSRNLSDSIRVELLRLTKDLSVEEKRVFNDSIQSRVDAMNCD